MPYTVISSFYSCCHSDDVYKQKEKRVNQNNLSYSDHVCYFNIWQQAHHKSMSKSNPILYTENGKSDLKLNGGKVRRNFCFLLRMSTKDFFRLP